MKHNLYSIIIHFKIGWPVYSAKGCVPHFLNVLLRAAGQVSSILYYYDFLIIFFLFFKPVFVNNPISGLLIFIATFVADWKIGVATVLAGSIATLGEMVSFINYININYRQHFQLLPIQVE